MVARLVAERARAPRNVRTLRSECRRTRGVVVVFVVGGSGGGGRGGGWRRPADRGVVSRGEEGRPGGGRRRRVRYEHHRLTDYNAVLSFTPAVLEHCTVRTRDREGQAKQKKGDPRPPKRGAPFFFVISRGVGTAARPEPTGRLQSLKPVECGARHARTCTCMRLQSADMYYCRSAVVWLTRDTRHVPWARSSFRQSRVDSS